MATKKTPKKTTGTRKSAGAKKSTASTRKTKSSATKKTSTTTTRKKKVEAAWLVAMERAFQAYEEALKNAPTPSPGYEETPAPENNTQPRPSEAIEVEKVAVAKAAEALAAAKRLSEYAEEDINDDAAADDA